MDPDRARLLNELHIVDATLRRYATLVRTDRVNERLIAAYVVAAKRRIAPRLGGRCSVQIAREVHLRSMAVRVDSAPSDADQLHAALDTLSPAQRSALLLTAGAGFTGRETADIIGTDPATVFDLVASASALVLNRTFETTRGDPDALSRLLNQDAPTAARPSFWSALERELDAELQTAEPQAARNPLHRRVFKRHWLRQH